jgi:hypothetical protein
MEVILCDKSMERGIRLEESLKKSYVKINFLKKIHTWYIFLGRLILMILRPEMSSMHIWAIRPCELIPFNDHPTES